MRKSGFIRFRLRCGGKLAGSEKHHPASDSRSKSYLAHVPDAVLASNDPVSYGAFLRGLFEADGTVVNGARAPFDGERKAWPMTCERCCSRSGIPTSTRIRQIRLERRRSLRVASSQWPITCATSLKPSDSSVTVSAAPCVRATRGRALKATASSCVKDVLRTLVPHSSELYPRTALYGYRHAGAISRTAGLRAARKNRQH